MNPSPLQYILHDTGPSPRTAVLWLHGLGADGHDFEPLVPVLGIPADIPLRFVFPHAPVRPVTINGGMAMRAWYDLTALSPGPRESADDLREAVTAIRDLGQALRAECPGLIVGGFSQGGAAALATALATDLQPTGVFALSSYLPDLGAAGLGLDTEHGHHRLDVFQAHGLADPVIPVQSGRTASQGLRDLGLSVDYREYAMGHQVCEEEIRDLRTWLFAKLDT